MADFCGLSKNVFSEKQIQILLFLERVKKLKQSAINKNSYIPLETFNGKQALFWLYKYTLWQKKALLNIKSFIGDDIEIFLTESRFFYKKGDFCFSSCHDLRYKGQRRGRYEMHGVKIPPSVYLEVFDGKRWGKYEK